MTHSRVFVLAIGLMSVLPACDSGPEYPSELVFQGARLERATEWSSGDISGAVFVPPGETLEQASIQLGILVSKEHASGVRLHQWIMEQYHRAPTMHLFESTGADEACKVGVGEGRRSFVALHVCRAVSGISACAESDERFGEDVLGRCLNTGGCWDELCRQMWATKRDALEAEALRILETR